MVSAAANVEAVRWHDAECGRYTADLPVWRALAGEVPRPVLDLGCGTGRVALALARDGHSITAVDSDEDLLAALAERAGTLDIELVHGDIRELSLGARRWPLVLVPMQTIQLLGGAEGRGGLFAGAAAHLAPSGELGIAVVTRFHEFCEDDERPLPDTLRADGALYVSSPLAVRSHGGSIAVERDRRVFTMDGPLRPAERDVIRLDAVDVATLAAEARRVALALDRVIEVPETDDHVANEVVVFRAGP